MTIYRNSIGGLEDGLTISATTNPVYTSEIKYFSTSSVSDAPNRKWDGTTSVDSMVYDMVAAGWTCEVRKDGHGNPVINCTHIETKAAIDKMKKAEEAKFADADQGYIRYGEIPKSGKSWNFRDNCPEDGVSVFEADFAKDGSYRPILNDVLTVSFLNVSDRQAYRIYGDVVGMGADGEPLINVSKAVKQKG